MSRISVGSAERRASLNVQPSHHSCWCLTNHHDRIKLTYMNEPFFLPKGVFFIHCCSSPLDSNAYNEYFTTEICKISRARNSLKFLLASQFHIYNLFIYFFQIWEKILVRNCHQSRSHFSFFLWSFFLSRGGQETGLSDSDSLLPVLVVVLIPSAGFVEKKNVTWAELPEC